MIGIVGGINCPFPSSFRPQETNLASEWDRRSAPWRIRPPSSPISSPFSTPLPPLFTPSVISLNHHQSLCVLKVLKKNRRGLLLNQSFLNLWSKLLLDESKKRLRHAGYEQISERDDWKLEAGKKYFFTRNYSTIVVFVTKLMNDFVRSIYLKFLSLWTDM